MHIKTFFHTWSGTGNWNAASQKKNINLSSIVNIMAADDLVKQGDGTPAAMILT